MIGDVEDNVILARTLSNVKHLRILEDEDHLSTGAIIDLVVDFFFLIDIFINFISSFEDQTTGLPIVSLKEIAINYLTSWFFIDAAAVFPTQYIEKAFKDDSSGASNG